LSSHVSENLFPFAKTSPGPTEPEVHEPASAQLREGCVEVFGVTEWQHPSKLWLKADGVEMLAGAHVCETLTGPELRPAVMRKHFKSAYVVVLPASDRLFWTAHHVKLRGEVHRILRFPLRESPSVSIDVR
jgi:hypothetical protein